MLKFLRGRLSSGSSTKRGAAEAKYVDLTAGVPLDREQVDNLRQGDICLDIKGFEVGWADSIGLYPCPEGVVVLSQTCDLVKPDVASVQVAPLVKLTGSDAGNAKRGQASRYVSLPHFRSEYFADLSSIGTLHKRRIVASARVPGVDPADHREIARVGQAIGRRFSRYAFPDNVVPWLRPLQDFFRSKALKPNSPLFAVAECIDELRLESLRGWTSAEPHDLVLLVITRPGVLPDPDAIAEFAGAGTLDLDGLTAIQVAEKWPSLSSDPAQVQHYWDRFSDALADMCHPRGDPEAAVRNAVRGFTGSAISADELDYSRVKRSAEIDLDDLSG